MLALAGDRRRDRRSSAVAPEGHDPTGAAHDRRRAGRRRAGHPALDVPSHGSRTRSSRRRRRSSPTDDLDLVVWPENVIDVDDEPFAGSDELTPRSRPRRPGSACRSRSASPRTPSSPAHPSRGAFVNAQVVVTPDGEVTSRYEKVRTRAVRRVRAAARAARGARRAGRPGAERRRRRARDPAVIELPDGTRLGRGDLVGGVLRRARAVGDAATAPATRRSCSTRPTAPATPAPSCRPSRSRRAGCGRSRPGAGWCRSSPTGFSAFVDARRRRVPAHRRQRAARDHDGRADCARGGPGTRRSATGRGSSPSWSALLAVSIWLGDARRRQTGVRRSSISGDRAVVDELDLHLGAEAAGGDRARRAVAARSTTASTSGSACSGRAAVDPARAAALVGVAVERELADDEHLAGCPSAASRRASGSSRRRRRRAPAGARSCRPACAAIAASSSWVTPTSTHRPGPISPAIRSSRRHRTTTTTRRARHVERGRARTQPSVGPGRRTTTQSSCSVNVRPNPAISAADVVDAVAPPRRRGRVLGDRAPRVAIDDLVDQRPRHRAIVDRRARLPALVDVVADAHARGT